MKITIKQPLSFSEIGRKDNQEDYLWPLPCAVKETNQIFLLCDGVGGQEYGEVASRVAATALGTYITEHFSVDGIVTKVLFEEALAYAYDELDKADVAGSQRRMGTTMTCLVLHSGGALVAHIGDSRIYHLRPSLSNKEGLSGIIYQSADHSLVNELLRLGEITEEEAASFPRKNVITRAMQPHQEYRDVADVYNITDIESGDYFFLCSDGVLEQLTNDMLGKILSNTNLSDEEKINEIKNVCDGKTRDNYTCWLIPIDKVESEDSDEMAEDEELLVTVESEAESSGQSIEPKEEDKKENRSSLLELVLNFFESFLNFFIKKS